MLLTHDPYIAAKKYGIYQQIEKHNFQHVNAGEIVERIMKSRALYEERQRLKAEKAKKESVLV